jgi:6-phosphogluconolactonase/glucosamine-6-phosphate isomerase/deaminase
MNFCRRRRGERVSHGSEIHWFIGDERAVPVHDSMNNGGMAWRAFLEACSPPSNVHLIAINNAALDETARAYERELQRFQHEHRTRGALFDLVSLGLGPDGHVASLFPDNSALHETRRWVVAVDRANVAPFVPRIRLTLPSLGDTREVLFPVTGEAKRDILARVFGGEDLPAIGHAPRPAKPFG